MQRNVKRKRELLLFGLLGIAAVVAVALALLHGSGTLTAPTPPPPPPPPPVVKERPLREIPDLVLPKDFPTDAGRVLWEVWQAARFRSSAEAVEAIDRKLTPRGKGGPFDDCAPAALEAMAPTFEVLIRSDDGPLAQTSMRSVSALALRGGPAGREALARTGLVEKAFALQAATGPAALRVETARNLGAVGGKAAVEWLVLLLRKAPESQVRVAAVEALGPAAMTGNLAPEAVLAIRACIEDRSAPAPLLRACIATVDRAWDSFKGYEMGQRIVPALDSSEDAVIAAAVGFFGNHPVPDAGPGLLRALGHKDPRIVEAAADALAELRPPGAKPALESRKADLKDPAALRAIERALKRFP